MAEVFLAVSSGPAAFRKLVVLKQMHRRFLDDPEVEAMFLDEVRISARLNHPNVVQAYAAGREDGLPFLCMEHLEGQSLHRIQRRISRDDGLSLGMQLRVLAEALSGLHYAHELRDHDGTPLGLIHRDVSPQNIFVTYAGQVKVIDFGIAKALGACHETAAGVLKGKPSYIAPEQVLDELVDRRADVFAAGVILWEMLTGQRLFKDASHHSLWERLKSDSLPAPRSVDPSVPPRLDAICMRALARRPEDRYASAADLQHDLEEVIEPLLPQCSLRDIGKLVEDGFREDRARLQARIRTELAAEAPAEVPRPEAQPEAPRSPESAPTVTSVGEATPAPHIARRSVRWMLAAAPAAILSATVALVGPRAPGREPAAVPPAGSFLASANAPWQKGMPAQARVPLGLSLAPAEGPQTITPAPAFSSAAVATAPAHAGVR
jgi:serine/threonine-protein kinase